MPKIKTHSGAKKRFALTKNGKVKRGKAFRSHILTKKSPQKMRNLKSPKTVHSANIDSVNAMLCK